MLYTEKNDNNIFERHRIIGTIVCITVIPLLISIGILFKFIPNAMVNQMVHIGSPLMVIASIFLFYVFKNFSFYSKYINKLARTSLGVYILHENHYFIDGMKSRGLIWDGIFGLGKRFLDRDFWIWFIIAVVVVCIICMAIDVVREKFERQIFKIKSVKNLCKLMNHVINIYP